MTISISSSLPAESAAADSPSAAPAPKAQPIANNTADVVKLSASQQIHQLYSQGQRISQIAFSLNLPIETVNSYLGITNTTS